MSVAIQIFLLKSYFNIIDDHNNTKAKIKKSNTYFPCDIVKNLKKA